MIRLKRLPEDITTRINDLRDYLQDRPEVVFAYVFGTLASGRVNPLSDIDIAVYLKDPEGVDYLELYCQVSEVLGTDELDLVLLNRAPVSLAGRVLMQRKVLVDKEPFLRHAYESLIIREFLDFREFERRLFQRRFKTG